MKMYVLQAELNKLVTSQQIAARDDFSATVLATMKINANYVSDKRYAIGNVILKNPEGKVVWEVKAEEPITKKKEVK